MVIDSIYIKQYSTAHINITEDQMFHKKSLPFLSVVQSVEGGYGISIDSDDEQMTGTMGVFIAPKEKMQYIKHYTSPETGVMRAQWIFLDVIINDMYRLDDIYDFPVLLPTEYNRQVYHIIADVERKRDLCDKLSNIYKLIKILLAVSTPKANIDQEINAILHYISLHYAEVITPKQLACRFGVSTATLFRKFKKFHGVTPSNHINSVRLSQAAMLLEIGALPIGQICKEIGIDDIFYFSKLFKVKYGLSPLNYRKHIGTNP